MIDSANNRLGEKTCLTLGKIQFSHLTYLNLSMVYWNQIKTTSGTRGADSWQKDSGLSLKFYTFVFLMLPKKTTTSLIMAAVTLSKIVGVSYKGYTWVLLNSLRKKQNKQQRIPISQESIWKKYSIFTSSHLIFVHWYSYRFVNNQAIFDRD